MENPKPTAAELEERQKAEERARKIAEQRGAGDASTMAWLKDMFSFILKLIFGDPDAPQDEDPSQPPISMSERVRTAKDFVASGAVQAFADYRKTHAAQAGHIMHINPVDGVSVVTSGKGARSTGISGASRNHQGIDIDVTQGETAAIKASADGIVVFSGMMNGYGNTVVIGHADGTKTLYAHMTGAHMPKIKQEVEQGEIIGQMGNTTNGRIKNMKVHLHYEQIVDGQRITPHIHGQEMHKGMALALDEKVKGSSQHAGHDHTHVASKLTPTALAAVHAVKPLPTLKTSQKTERFAHADIADDGKEKKPPTVFATGQSLLTKAGAMIGLG